jgi:N-acetylglucosamine-6-phosphate deacetylase
MNKKVIKNGKIILPDGIVEGHYLVIEDGVIKHIAVEYEPTGNEEWIDAENQYVSPGFFDTHIHGAGHAVWEMPDTEAFRGICSFLISKGVTSFMPTILPNEDYIRSLVKNIDASPEFRENILGIYIEGPFVNLEKKGGINPEYIRKPDVDYLKKIVDLAEGKLRMMTIAPELEGIDEIIDFMLDHDIIPSLGHSLTSLDVALSKTKAKNITHLFNAMSGISHKDPGLAALPFIRKDIYTEVNGDGIHINDLIIKMCFDHLNRERLIFITDAVISAGLPYGNYFYDSDKAVISSERGVRYKENDVLIGSSFLIPDVLRHLKKITGGEMHELINTVTLNPARLLAADHDRGSIEPGKKANIVIFDDDFNIKKVLSG